MDVALFTRAWIEILAYNPQVASKRVALFTRAWIEMIAAAKWIENQRRPLHEGVD